jgi:hypothetical protein
MVIQQFTILQNDVEPLPEPFRTIFFVLIVLGALIIPIFACLFSLIRRSMAKSRVEELGVSWDEVDAQIPKPEDAMIDNITCLAILVIVIFAGIMLVLTQVIGPIVRDLAVLILMGLVLLLIVVCCPIGMIWSIRVDERKNAERIRLAEEQSRMRETGEYSESSD